MTGKTVYLETFGCQMNVLDSELVLATLGRLGYEQTADAGRADLVLLNTCSVRAHAEQKVYSRLGDLRRAKRQRPGMVLGVIGCMAQRDPEAIATLMPHVDLLCGPGRLNELPELIEQVANGGGRVVALSDSKRRPDGRGDICADDIEQLDVSRDPTVCGAQAYVRVQRGCDKFCSFCVVPYVRGREQSRPAENILGEVRNLAAAGVRQVTLLGQTVNSYAYRDGARTVRLADLLAMVHEVAGIDRIRFVTSYPGDFDLAILAAMRDLPKVCEYLHLPAQSGSNRILKAMRRQYTVEQYNELIEMAREMVPEISLVGDFIVGFPGESDEDFEASCRLLLRTRYKNVFVFRYSPRPGTVADRRVADEVPIDVKRRRNAELLRLQEQVSLEQNRRLVGQGVEVLVEGASKAALKARRQHVSQTGSSWRSPQQLAGRTRGHQIVVFDGPDELTGRTVKVRIVQATALTLHANLVDEVG